MIGKKDIKAAVRKQLKQKFPYWSKLTKKNKRELGRKVLDEVKTSYLNGKINTFSNVERLSIESIPEGVKTIETMRDFIKKKSNWLFSLPNSKINKERLDSEKRLIDTMLDDTVINSLLAPDGYTPSKREKKPAVFFRAELLKSLDYAEMSYRKFCEKEINDLERKKNRAFIGLSLKRNIFVHHTELSMFRSSLTWKQNLNLMVYILTIFLPSDLEGDAVIFGLDSTDLAAKVNTAPLAKINITLDGKEECISIYNQIDVDCGDRRSKRDKSKFFVGYRNHCLTVIHPDTGKAYPLLSLMAPANHHDSNFLAPIISLAKAVGLEVKLLVADTAYDGTDLKIIEEDNVLVVTEARNNVAVPDYVVIDQGIPRVYLGQYCETPMKYLGRHGSLHEFACNNVTGTCPFKSVCHQSRTIPMDNGLFGPIPKMIKLIKKVEQLRRVIERPFNLMKHRNGTDTITVKSLRAAQAVVTFNNIAVLLIENARTGIQRKEKKKQIEFKFAA